MKFKQFIYWLIRSENKKISDSTGSSPFIDLTPVDNADSDGSYAKALSFAFENSSIYNIALTGPYGSGKSSIIRTYEKNNNYKFLNISLASFKEEKDSSVNPVLIERSILQQMLYGADANKLPYSRFKRIATPTQPLIKALVIVAWAIDAYFVYVHRNEFISLLSYSLIPFVDFAIAIPVVIISDIYKASFGMSIKKVSLMNAEIEAGESSENSILNRHLDEIIYFFQATNYDVVVIEDLDRFGSPEIFVKLREINKLINDNNVNKSQHPIKFLYALKDDMFVHKNRAKFFDFIIPVLPVIDSSNSLDKMQERLSKLAYAKTIDTRFLREVSLYIDDMRLIHNIFNEFVIYYDHLKSEKLNVTKLLAMMIYKNVYPSDFEHLHYGKGVLFEICNKRTEFLQNAKSQLEEQLEGYRTAINMATDEMARSVQELISAYIGHIILHHSNNLWVFGIVCGGQQFAFSKITTFEEFQPILSERNIHLLYRDQFGRNGNLPTNKSFSQIEEEINPGETFLDRKQNIENKSAQKRIDLQKEIRRIENEIASVPYKQFAEIISSNDIKLDGLIDEGKLTNGKLLEYLVRNGYLDENYHLYISTFYEGRLTKNDRDFILTIRNFNPANPNQRIDTPREVCANIREEDFGSKYALNVALVDYLLDINGINSNRLKAAIHYISQNFKQSEEFFSTYFISGKNLIKFIRAMSLEWPDCAGVATDSAIGDKLISAVLRFVDAEYLSASMNKANVLTKYLSEHGSLVLASDLPLPENYDFLKKLNVRFDDLVLLEENEVLLRFAHEEKLFAINPQNVNFILKRFANTQSADILKPEKANYTSILASDDKILKDYVEQNLSDYIKNVFLFLTDNSDESEDAIQALINHDLIDDDMKKEIISKQSYVFKSFDGVPKGLWPHMLLEEKITVSWQNISKYLSYDDNDKEVVTTLLGRQNIVESLSNSPIKLSDLGENNCKSLSSFVLHNNEMQDSDYGKLIRRLPYNYLSFPTNVSKEKINILAKARKVVLTKESFDYAANDNQLKATLISKNIDEYIKEKDKYPIGDDVRELLLASEISYENKMIICLDVNLDGAINNKQLSRLISGLLLADEADCSKFDDRVILAAIVNAQTSSDSIRLLMKCLSNWDENKVMGVLANLPEPFSEISSYGKRPRLDNNAINLTFARLLETKGFVSSVKVEDDSIKINTFNSSDHSE
jgi:hypothetical protein